MHINLKGYILIAASFLLPLTIMCQVDSIVDNPIMSEMEMKNESKKFLASFDSLINSLKSKSRYDIEKKIRDKLVHFNFEKEELDNTLALVDEFEEERQKKLKLVRKFEAIAQRVKFINRTANRPAFLPVRCKNDFKYFDADSYNSEERQNHLLNNSKVMYNPNNRYFSIFTEVYKDYFNVVRLGIGSVIGSNIQSNNYEDQDSVSEAGEEEQYHNNFLKFSNGGGLIAFNLSYPIFSYIHEDAGFAFKSEIQCRIGIDPPGLSAKKDLMTNIENSLVSKLRYKGELDKISIIAESKISRMHGNDIFYNSINKADHKSFATYQFTIGFVLENKFQLTWNIIKGNTFVSNNSAASMGVLVNMK